MGDFIYRYVKQRRIEKIKLRKNKKSCWKLWITA
jgi:hypothetical protein